MYERLDPTLKHMLGLDEEERGSGIAGDAQDDPMHPVAALRFREEFGIDPPGSTRTPRTVAEIGKALDNLRRAVGGEQPYATRLQKLGFPLAQMAQAAVEFSGPTSPTTEFLRAAAAGSDSDMRIAIRRMLTEDAPPIN